MLRTTFHEQLAEIDADTTGMFERVTAAVATVTDRFLTGNTVGDAPPGLQQAAEEVLTKVERQLEVNLTRQAPVASDLRFLVTVLRVMPQLDRCLALTTHIARRAPFARALPSPVRVQFALLGGIASEMWSDTRQAWVDRDDNVASALDERDDDLDAAAADLKRLAAAADITALVGMECALVARFYERLGDHAVHVCERIRWCRTGTV